MYSLKHILIVDDDLTNNLFTQIILEDAGVGHRISVCQRVQEALDLLHSAAQQSDIDFPDLILLGEGSPLLSSTDFLTAYHSRGYDRKHHATIFLFSTMPDQALANPAHLHGGIAGFVGKPLSLLSLNELLTNARLAEVENKLA